MIKSTKDLFALPNKILLMEPNPLLALQHAPTHVVEEYRSHVTAGLGVQAVYMAVAFGCTPNPAVACFGLPIPGNHQEGFESTGIHPLNPRTVLGKLKPKWSEESRDITRTYGTSPPITPTAPRATSHPKYHAPQMVTRNSSLLNKLKVLIDPLGRLQRGQLQISI